MTEGWHNPLLECASGRLAGAREEYARLKRRFEALAGAGTYEAAVELDEIRPRLDAVVAEMTAADQDVKREAEVQAVINKLMPTFVTLRGILERTSQEFCERADVPNDEREWVPFVLKDRELERLRLTIVQAVGPAEAERLDLSRPYSHVAAVQQHWEAVHRDRERLAVLHGPGNKIRLGQVPWFEAADRLARLRAAGTAQREHVHAR